MSERPCGPPPETPGLFALVDREDGVRAWVIELPEGSVLAIFTDGVAVHTTYSTERALNFVNRSEDIAGRLIAVQVSWPEGVRTG